MNAALDVPPQVHELLEELTRAATEALQEQLVSITLYGSAAEGRLRPTSDVNVVVVLERFEQRRVDALREPLRRAKAAIGLDAMFLLQSELTAAVEAFPEKFADLARRRKVLHGADVFAQVQISRETTIARLKQVLLNLILRTRRAYLERSLREEQLALLIADEAGPLRSAAATLLELEGRPSPHPKEALLEVAEATAKGRYAAALHTLSQARETRRLEPGVGAPTVFALIELAEALRERASRLQGGAK